jgi:hypothetical protein
VAIIQEGQAKAIETRWYNLFYATLQTGCQVCHVLLF